LLNGVTLKGGLLAKQRRDLDWAARKLRADLLCDSISTDPRHEAAGFSLSLEMWRHSAAKLTNFDRLFHYVECQGDVDLALTSFDWGRDVESARQLLTRYQRLLPLPPKFRRLPRLEGVLEAHRALHDSSKPLVRADFDHSLDTWRWVLRLCPEASAPLQLAALFHDIERLETEADARVEHLARDYLTFKRRHAARGAHIAARVLAPVGIDTDTLERMVELIAAHEQPREDFELMLLNDADALSFFSLNSCGYLRYFGVTQTWNKVDYTLRRMSRAARALLPTLRHPPLINDMLRALQTETESLRAGAIHG
jgi:hypothetical protein